MTTRFSPQQIEFFKREATALAAAASLGHSQALDRISHRYGFDNWSLLMKASASVPALNSPPPRPPILFTRSVGEMAAAMRRVKPEGRYWNANTHAASIREGIGDIHFASAINAVNFAVAYLKQALAVPRYRMDGYSRAYYEMRAWLPYCVHDLDVDLRILVGRNYKPVGTTQVSERVDYHLFDAQHISMANADRALISVDKHSHGYLYDASPWVSRRYAEDYLKQLLLLQTQMRSKRH